MNCPVCEVPLIEATVEDVPVLRCTTCRGVWFDERGFEAARDGADPSDGWREVP
jgi:Zn-finger nucleic acid-binding protein